MMNKAQILEMIENEKKSLRKLTNMFEDLLETYLRTQERIKEWEELAKEFDKKRN